MGGGRLHCAFGHFIDLAGWDLIDTFCLEACGWLAFQSPFRQFLERVG